MASVKTLCSVDCLCFCTPACNHGAIFKTIKTDMIRAAPSQIFRDKSRARKKRCTKILEKLGPDGIPIHPCFRRELGEILDRKKRNKLEEICYEIYVEDNILGSYVACSYYYRAFILVLNNSSLADNDNRLKRLIATVYNISLKY